MSFGQATGNACGCRALPGRDNDAHPIVAAASHGTATGIHHEADQEPTRRSRAALEGEKKDRKINRSHTTNTSEEDESHAVITVHPNKVRTKEKKTETEKLQETE